MKLWSSFLLLDSFYLSLTVLTLQKLSALLYPLVKFILGLCVFWCVRFKNVEAIISESIIFSGILILTVF